MLRNLYRLYLYTILIALLIFADVALTMLLNTVLLLTPLRPDYIQVPTQAAIVQSLVFTGVALVIVGLLGGLHYRLIRRDLQHDPAAGSSGIRSFFLNITEAVALAIAVPTVGFGIINPLAYGNYPASGAVYAIATALPLLILAALMELERRRTPVDTGAALTFQRLHRYGLQIFLLAYMIQSMFNNISIIATGLITQETCNASNPCTYNYGLLVLTMAWFAAWWLGYGWLTSKDDLWVLRLIFHGGGLVLGAGYVLYSVALAVAKLISPLFGVGIKLGDFIGLESRSLPSFLIIGIILVAGYGWWLRKAAQQQLVKLATVLLVIGSFVAFVAALFFGFGGSNLLYQALKLFNHVNDPTPAQSWTQAIAFTVVGASYIVWEVYLRRRNTLNPDEAAGPRRGFVFGLLGVGVLASAIGGVVALYVWISALLGSPISQSPEIGFQALSALVAGICFSGFYLWSAQREQLFVGLGRQPVVTPSAPATGTGTDSEQHEVGTIEQILDDLLAGKLSRDEAAARLHQLKSAPV